MKNEKKYISRVNYDCILHTDDIRENSVFYAVKGSQCNSIEYIVTAVKNGARKIVIQSDNHYSKQSAVPIVYVENVLKQYALDSLESHMISSYDFVFIGVTGTKGKSSTVFALFHMLRSVGISVGMMSSIGHYINDDIVFDARLTTEMAHYIHAFLSIAKGKGVRYIVMEISAQAFSTHRIDGILFDYFIFNNFCQEHGEFYEHLSLYYQAKCSLYRYMKKDGVIVLNYDDAMVYDSSSNNIHNNLIISVSAKNILNADVFFSTFVKNDFDTYCSLSIRDKKWDFYSPWFGLHNCFNIINGLVVIQHMLKDEYVEKVLKKIVSLPQIPGRMEKILLPNKSIVFIDKAHTENSVYAVLESVIPYAKNIYVVFGCGGGKDIDKRSKMATLVEKYANKVVVTMDNPRYESLSVIFSDIAKGFTYSKDICFMYDRLIAIEYIINSSKSGDIILLLGKGDEQFQEVAGEKIPFSEKKIIAHYIEHKK